MLNSGSCEPVGAALDRLAGQQAEQVLRRLPHPPEGRPDMKVLEGVARDFASLFYSELVKQMQRTLRADNEDDGPMKQGVEDFFGMFLPRAVADDPDDALARYIYEQLTTRYGGRLDERA